MGKYISNNNAYIYKQYNIYLFYILEATFVSIVFNAD